MKSQRTVIVTILLFIGTGSYAMDDYLPGLSPRSTIAKQVVRPPISVDSLEIPARLLSLFEETMVKIDSFNGGLKFFVLGKKLKHLYVDEQSYFIKLPPEIILHILKRVMKNTENETQPMTISLAELVDALRYSIEEKVGGNDPEKCIFHNKQECQLQSYKLNSILDSLGTLKQYADSLSIQENGVVKILQINQNIVREIENALTTINRNHELGEDLPV